MEALLVPGRAPLSILIPKTSMQKDLEANKVDPEPPYGLEHSKAHLEAGLQDLPESWKKSIYEQAAEASAVALERKVAPGKDCGADE